MTLTYSKSLAAALRNTTATAARTTDGSLKDDGASSWNLICAKATAVLFVVTIGTVIAEWDNEASARLTSVRLARWAIIPTTASTVIAGWATVANERGAVWVPALILALALGFQLPLWLTALAAGQTKTTTHIVTDVVRHPRGVSGSGAHLVAALAADESRTIGGCAATERVWTRVYEPCAHSIGFDGKGRVRFVLRPTPVPAAA